MYNNIYNRSKIKRKFKLNDKFLAGFFDGKGFDELYYWLQVYRNKIGYTKKESDGIINSFMLLSTLNTDLQKLLSKNFLSNYINNSLNKDKKLFKLVNLESLLKWYSLTKDKKVFISNLQNLIQQFGLGEDILFTKVKQNKLRKFSDEYFFKKGRSLKKWYGFVEKKNKKRIYEHNYRVDDFISQKRLFEKMKKYKKKYENYKFLLESMGDEILSVSDMVPFFKSKFVKDELIFRHFLSLNVLKKYVDKGKSYVEAPWSIRLFPWNTISIMESSLKFLEIDHLNFFKKLKVQRLKKMNNLYLLLEGKKQWPEFYIFNKKSGFDVDLN